MKAYELAKHVRCDLCGHLIVEIGIPLFWTIKIERHGILMDAVKRHDGLVALMGGNQEMGFILGPDEEMTRSMLGPIEITACEKCYVTQSDLLFETVWRKAGDEYDDEEG